MVYGHSAFLDTWHPRGYYYVYGQFVPARLREHSMGRSTLVPFLKLLYLHKLMLLIVTSILLLIKIAKKIKAMIICQSTVVIKGDPPSQVNITT